MDAAALEPFRSCTSAGIRAESPAGRSECPGCDRETEQRERRDGVPPLATCGLRCNSARQLKDDPGIRPFFEPEKPRSHDCRCSGDLKDTYDRQDIHWVSETCDNLGYNRAANNGGPPVCQVDHASHECFERDEECRGPVQHCLSFQGVLPAYEVEPDSGGVKPKCIRRSSDVEHSVQEANQVFPRQVISEHCERNASREDGPGGA